MQRGFSNLIILSVFLLVTASAAFYYYGKNNTVLNSTIQTPIPSPINLSQQTASPSATPDQTANWKTYTSEEYKFSIKYPPTVTHSETLDSQQFNKSHEFFKVDGGTLEIYGLCGRGIIPIKRSDLTIAGQKTTKMYESLTHGVIAAINRPIPNESLCFNFALPEDSQKRESVDSLFDQMLSTLQFQ